MEYSTEHKHEQSTSNNPVQEVITSTNGYLIAKSLHNSVF
jgi:hypothetical protein